MTTQSITTQGMMMNQPFSRREILRTMSCGFGSMAFAGMCGQNALAESRNPLDAKPPMFLSRAKRVIFLFMAGGPSHVDTFDYKPDLFAAADKYIEFTGVRTKNFGETSNRKLFKPMWDFKRYGECDRWVSELFPNVGRQVDDLCFIHSMHTEGVAHEPSTLFLHTGATNVTRPSMGSWISYGLGTENSNLPAFVTIMPAGSNRGPRNYSNAFLPTVHQSTCIGRAMLPAKDAKIRNRANDQMSSELQQRQFAFMQKLNRQQVHGHDDKLEAAIFANELAWRMQMHAPGTMDMSNEKESTLKMYGMDEKHSEDFGRQCLMARKLSESGVRFIQVNYSDESLNPKWDQHNYMEKHMDHALATDKPVAGLLKDLKQRGLLEDTLVWWGGEFGRTPFTENVRGRDHNPRGFTVWLAGGGVKGGYAHGATDNLGHHAVEDKVHMHDLHATVLHLLGLDHEALTYRYAGRDFRLTDVSGNVVHEILA
jgi:hypothetical protein